MLTRNGVLVSVGFIVTSGSVTRSYSTAPTLAWTTDTLLDSIRRRNGP